MTRRFVACPGVPESVHGRLCTIKHQLKPTIMSVSAGMRDKLTTNQELFSVGVLINQPTEEVRVWTETVLSPHNGEIKRLASNKSLCVRPGQTMMVIECCPHEMKFNGLCAFRGADLTLITKMRHKSKAASERLPAPMASKRVLYGNQHGQRKIVTMSGSALTKVRTEHGAPPLAPQARPGARHQLHSRATWCSTRATGCPT